MLCCKCNVAQATVGMLQCQTFLGTVTYMSPERINGEPYSFPADIWWVSPFALLVSFDTIESAAGRGDASPCRADAHHAHACLAPLCPVSPPRQSPCGTQLGALAGQSFGTSIHMAGLCVAS